MTLKMNHYIALCGFDKQETVWICVSWYENDRRARRIQAWPCLFIHSSFHDHSVMSCSVFMRP